jgi:hypothetical protein
MQLLQFQTNTPISLDLEICNYFAMSYITLFGVLFKTFHSKI